MVDVASSAGFPGLPLRVLEPSIRLTLLDSLNKRIQFLETVCRELDLPDVACVHAGRKNLPSAGKARLAVSQAVAALPVLCELCLPLVKARPRGKFPGRRNPWSQTRASRLTARICDPGRRRGRSGLYHPSADVPYRLIVVEKVKKTPEKYPRMFAKKSRKIPYNTFEQQLKSAA